MLTLTDLDTIVHQAHSIVTIGTFDGIHVGHQKIINRIVAESRERNARSVLLTFDPHPQAVIHPERAAELRILTTPDEKKKILQDLGVDTLIVAKFDAQLAQKTGEGFIRDILIQKIGMKKCIVGHDHVFGKNRTGNFELLQAMGKSEGFEVERIEAFTLNNVVVNSTQIRTFIQAGNVESAYPLLGRKYALKGIVVRGDGRGKSIGFPTANLKVTHPQKLIPKYGVYVTSVGFEGGNYPSVTNIGTNPTFTDSDNTTIETYILNFDDDLYDKEIELFFLCRIRDEEKFNSVGELTQAIQNDVDFAVKKGFSIS